jgi:hypothetical protein
MENRNTIYDKENSTLISVEIKVLNKNIDYNYNSSSITSGSSLYKNVFKSVIKRITNKKIK